MTEPVISDQISLDEDWLSTKDTLLYATIANAVVTLVALALTIVKLRKVLIILSVMQNTVQKTHASALPSFHYKIQTTIPQPSQLLNDLDLTMEHIILFVVLATFVLILGLSCYFKEKNQEKHV